MASLGTYPGIKERVGFLNVDSLKTLKEKKQINDALYYTELSWIKKICEDNFGKIQVFKNQLLKDDVTILIKKSA